MYTLIEIFDSKQYENIIAPMFLNNLSKVFFVGSYDTMTKEKEHNLRNFFRTCNFSIPVEFYRIKRDEPVSVFNCLERIVSDNPDCIFDVTGGEDSILTCVGICAERYSVPVFRINSNSKEISVLHKSFDFSSLKETSLRISDFITLQGGKIHSCTPVNGFSAEVTDDIINMFSVNARDCESYSSFCNFVSEFISYDNKKLIIPKKEIIKHEKVFNSSYKKILDDMCRKNLLSEISTSGNYSYSIKSLTVVNCLKKSGNILEYYTALGTHRLKDLYSDIKIGASIVWNNISTTRETLNEIDVVAVSDNVPVFISCKNGETKKEALYELDSVSRVLGGVYTKKILVCTFISNNRSAREHLIKRAEDMNIHLIYNTHKLSFEDFLHYLKKAITD